MFELDRGRTAMTAPDVLHDGRSRMLKRLLRVGFWFFLLKGLMWLVLPVVLHQALLG
jgi:hypothetical protein